MTIDLDLQLLAGLAGLMLGLAALAAVWAWCRGGVAPGQVPSRVGPYALSERLGGGAMGVVYRARHVGTGQRCAVKLLPREAGERERRQFEQEARHAARLCHPNAVHVFESGVAADGTLYQAMDLVEGTDLEQLVEREGPQPASRVIEILLQVCAALAAAHAQGLIHRDVKPSNIVLSRAAGKDAIKLLDFGLARHVAEPATSHDEAVVGTPLYISPEAITSPAAVDGRSDLYGLGAVAYFLLSGAPVFDGQSVLEVCSQHLLAAPEPLHRVVGWSLGADLEALIHACLEKQPSARPSSAEELARRLAACADAESSLPAARRRVSDQRVDHLALSTHEALV